jgi:hypothetical protein
MFALLSRRPREILLKTTYNYNPVNAMSNMNIRAVNAVKIGTNEFLEQTKTQNQRDITTQAHINRLPNTLIVRIFKMAIDEHDSLVVGSLLFVCSEWHTITKGAPLL